MKKFALYVEKYLPVSATFIYNQLMGVENDYQGIVFTQTSDYLDIFPPKKLYEVPKAPVDLFFYKVKNKFKPFSKKPPVNPGLSEKQISRFVKLFRKESPNFIHAHFGPSAIEIFPVVKELSLPSIITFHGYDASMLLNYPIYVQHLQKVTKNAVCLCVSEHLKKNLEAKGVSPDKIMIHHCGISIDHFDFIRREPAIKKVKKGKKITFLQVSNFVEKKGHIYTIRAFKEFLKLYKNAELILAGNGELYEKIRKIAVQEGLDDKIIFPGTVYKEQVKELMEKADVFLHHSITASSGDQEGIPTVIMEAMATGLPVISTYHSGIPELIKDEVTGYLVNEKNVEEYVDKMEHVLLTNSELSENARTIVAKEFNNSIQAERLKNIYHLVK